MRASQSTRTHMVQRSTNSDGGTASTGAAYSCSNTAHIPAAAAAVTALGREPALDMARARAAAATNSPAGALVELGFNGCRENVDANVGY